MSSTKRDVDPLTHSQVSLLLCLPFLPRLMRIVVSHSRLDLCHGLVDQLQSSHPMSALVVRSCFEIVLRFAQVLDGCTHFGLRFAGAPFPPVTPVRSSPVSSAPAAEMQAVDKASFAILEHALLPFWSAGIDAECLRLPWVGVHAKRAVAHPECAIATGQLLQSVGDVHVAAGGSVLRVLDYVLARITILSC